MENSHDYIVTQILLAMHHLTNFHIQYELIIWVDFNISHIWHGKRQEYLYFNNISRANWFFFKILILWWKYRCTNDLRGLELCTDILKSTSGRGNLEMPCIVSCNDIDFQRFDVFPPRRTGQLSIYHIVFVIISKYSIYSIFIGKMRIACVLGNFQLSSISPVMKVHYWAK